MNLNKLVPRLSIRTKLVTAFVLLSIVPLGTVFGVGAVYLTGRARDFGTTTLAHDLRLVRQQTRRSLLSIQDYLSYMSHSVVPLILAAEGEAELESVGRILSPLVGEHTKISRILVIDADGVIRFSLRGENAPGLDRDDTGATSGLLYLLWGEALDEGEFSIMPVELRALSDTADSLETEPALAFVYPIFAPGGDFLGVLVGEADAARVFAGVDQGSPYVEGTTVLIGRDGMVFYHSDLKRDWASLLGDPREIELADNLPEGIMREILAGRAGTSVIGGDRMISYAAIGEDDAGIGDVMIYRIVRQTAFQRSISTASAWFGVGGVVLLVFVFALGLSAARQFTKPIYLLRRGVQQLAAGEIEGPIVVHTNDEFEDFAADFSTVAVALNEHRTELAALVEERTMKLKRAHGELEALWKNSVDAIVGTDPDMIVKSWNRGAEMLFGFTEAEAVGRPLSETITGESDAERRFISKELEEHGAVVDLITERRRKTGAPVPVSITTTRIAKEDGDILGYSFVIRDYARQLLLDEQMRRSERLAAMSVMAAGLAHEINNPLAVLGNRIECMQRDLDTNLDRESIDKDLGVLAEHTNRLRDLTQDLLRFARDDEVLMEPVSFSDVARRMVKLLDRTFSRRNIRVRLEVDDGLPTFIGSVKSIETVLVNLLINAADETPENGVVTVATSAAPGRVAVELSVADTGPGVPDHLHNAIFEPFYTTKTAGKGTGLGLAVCRSIMEKSGGTITVDASYRSGGRFVVRQPITRVT